MGKKMAGTNEFASFAVKHMYRGGSRIRPKKFEKCLPAGTGTKIYFSSFWPKNIASRDGYVLLIKPFNFKKSPGF